MAQHKLLKQFLKFWVGGGLYFWSGYAVFALCYSVLDLWWLWAKILADIVGWSLNYFVQRYWAFASDHMKLSEMQHVGRYLFIETVGFTLDYAIIAGLTALGVTPYVGFFAAAAFFTVWNFLWYKYWVFPEEKRGIIKA
ncbi:MAG TPA: GtrA family protein [Candidatus Saccharimonadales bacterium]|nr:GtrA family protein [Candidatus Saccharimonadales bacterium]